jgi:hypothetical protein
MASPRSFSQRQRKLPGGGSVRRASSFCPPLAGERRTAGILELMKLAQTEALDRAPAHAIVEQTRHAVSQWREFAAAAGVPAITAAEVGAYLNKGPAAQR